MNSLEIVGFKNITLESFNYDYSEQIEKFEEMAKSGNFNVESAIPDVFMIMTITRQTPSI